MTSFMTSPYSIRDDVTQPVIIVENFDIFLGEKSTSSVIRVTFFHFVQVRLPFNSQTDSGRGDTIISKFLTEKKKKCEGSRWASGKKASSSSVVSLETGQAQNKLHEKPKNQPD
ncbi:hypothetical protein YC2023_110807 [Brassica napus]